MRTRAFIIYMASLLVAMTASCDRAAKPIEAELKNPGMGLSAQGELPHPAMDDESPAPASDGPAYAGRLVMRQASLSIEVDAIDEAQDRVRGIVVKLGGFIADSRSFEDDAGRKSLSFTLRLPSSRLDELLNALKSLGHVRQEALSGEDITEQYADLEARLANSKRLEARLLDILGQKSKSLKDVLDVEREISRVREAIETAEARRRFYDTRTALATVELSITEPPGFGRGIFDPLSGSIQRALHAFTASLAWLTVVISAAIPWIAVAMLFAWLVVRGLRWILKRKREARAKRHG